MSGEPFAFQCRCCGNCCSRPDGFVRIAPEEEAGIAGELGITIPALRSLYLDRLLSDGTRLLKSGDGPSCPFLERGQPAKCRIYKARPKRCATFPFWDETLEGEGGVEELKRFCPGIR